MRRLILKELLLLSKEEKKARKISFGPETTVVIGDNRTGKSSLLKNIYYSLGANVQFDSKWESAYVINLINFNYNNVDYSLLRSNNTFALFDHNLNLIKAVQRITSGISPLLADLFGFNLKLKQRDGSYALATPAYQFLPYYIDQDKGWLNLWDSFEDLQQFNTSKREVVEYHVGIKPKEYYDITARISQVKSAYEKIKSEKEGLIYAKNKLEAESKTVEFDIDIETYKDEIEALLLESSKLNNRQNEYKAKLVKLNNEKILIEQQINIAEVSLKELNEDYRYASEKVMEDHVECPTCGTDFENSFINRFSIAEDASVCQNILIQLKEELILIQEKVTKVENEFLQNKTETELIQKLLDQKKGVIQFRDIIRSESQKEIKNVFKESIEFYNRELQKLHTEELDLIEMRKKYIDNNRAKVIKQYYNSTMQDSLLKLSIYNNSSKDYMNFPVKIKDSSGTIKPRAVMAYYYSMLKTMQKYSTSSFFPIVIDSPNQQDQDRENRTKIIQFTLDEKPRDFQLILASVELYEAKYNDYLVKLKNNYSLLLKDEFDEVDNFMSPLIEQAYKKE